MKRMTYFVMALAMVLGFTQCKKEQLVEPTENEGVFITLNVNGGASTGSAADGSRVVVTPGYTDPNTGQTYAKVEYEEGDVIYVGYKGAKVGTLEYSGGAFSGTVNISEGDYGEKLHFYFLGGKGFDVTVNETDNTASVNISNQTEKYPVISYNTSNETFTGTGSYSSRLKNKVSIMKFNVDTPSTAAICITGMNNTVSVNFATPNGTDNGFSYSQTDGGLIKMHGVTTENTETWAVVLPQTPIAAGDAYTVDNAYTGTRPAIDGGIGSNQYLSAGVAITVNTFNPLATPLTLEALTGGTIVVDDPQDGMQYSLNGSEKTAVTSDAIAVSAGDKVQFYGNGTSYNSTTISGGTAQVKAYGNIMSLIDETGYATLTTLLNQDYVFMQLFYGNTNLTDASGLLLPATTLASGCYYEMFLDCTGLTTAPALPATTLADANGCYSNMFDGCTSLVTAPALPATTLAEYCYSNMFDGCTSLTTAPVLPATTLVYGCYSSMFLRCTSLSSITCLATAGINEENFSTYNWVNSVASTGTFTKASGATWPSGRDGIPYDWEVNEQ